MQRARLLGTTAATLVVVACASGSGSGSGALLGSREESDFRKQIEAALCEHAATCCRLHGFSEPAPACDIHDVVPLVNDVHVPVQPPSRDYPFDSREAARCLRAVRARAPSCRIPGFLPECRQVWHVDGELGAVCTNSADCNTSSEGFVRCTGRCTLDTPPADFPHRGLPVGAACMDYHECATANCQVGRCVEDFYTKPRVCAPSWHAR